MMPWPYVSRQFFFLASITFASVFLIVVNASPILILAAASADLASAAQGSGENDQDLPLLYKLGVATVFDALVMVLIACGSVLYLTGFTPFSGALRKSALIRSPPCAKSAIIACVIK